MHINCTMKNNGMYIMSAGDFDVIAKDFLQEYLPDALVRAQPIDIDYIIGECLYLEIQHVHLSYDGSVLGLIAFADTSIRCLDEMYRVQEIPLAEGTMLIDSSLLLGRDKLPRLRFTKAHEASHWICHRSYHSNCNRVYDCRSAVKPLVACRAENIEASRKSGGRQMRTDSDWEEWQADSLAASLLMPKDIFIETVHVLMQCCGTLRKSLKDDWRDPITKQVVEYLAQTFLVSRKAAEIRLRQLQLMY